jgi:hypothetical protein
LDDEEERAHLAGLLRGQIQLLLPRVERSAADLHGETGQTADYAIAHAKQALTRSLVQARDPDELFDLALISRSLLTLHELATLARQLRALPGLTFEQQPTPPDAKRS